jgi:hypothetical protein
MITNRLAWENIRTVDSTTLTGSFQTIGLPLVYPSYICKMVNNSNVLITISIDGTNTVDVVPPYSFWLYDEGKGAPYVNQPALPAGTQFLISGAASGSNVGSIYLVTQYIVSN